MHLSVEHLGLAARDPAKLKDWHVRVLGARVVFESGSTPPTFFLEMPGGLLLEIYQGDFSIEQTGQNNLTGWRHVAVRVDSIAAAQEQLTARGVVFSGPIKAAGGGGQVLFFKDEEGNLLHLVERPAGSVFGKSHATSGLAPELDEATAPAGAGKMPALHSKSSLRAIIFDLDGVIVDSEPLHEQAYREVFAELGYGESHGIDFTRYYGKSDQALWEDFVAKHEPKQPFAELFALKQGRFLDILRRERPIFRGLPELVERLAARYKLAVASGSSHPVIETALSLQNLRRFFPVVVSALDVPRGKPAPDIFLRVAELLGVASAACCVIEDADVGVEGALAAGMSVIAITNTLPVEKLAKATRVVSSYGEIERLLL